MVFEKQRRGAKMRLAIKQFQKQMENTRKMIKQGEFKKVQATLLRSCIKGLNHAEQVFDNPEKLGDADAEKILENMDIDKVEHEKTRFFLERLRSMELNEESLMDFVDDFENYYLNRLEELK